MARPLRVSFRRAVYHVMSRGNNRQPVFLDDRDCGGVGAGEKRHDIREAQVLRRHVSEPALWKKVEEVTGRSREEMMKDRGTLRWIVMELLCRRAGLRGADVARMFGLSEGAVSLYRKRVRKRVPDDENLASPWDELNLE